MKKQTNINLFFDVNRSNEIDGYVNAHIKYIVKNIIQKATSEIELLLTEKNEYSSSPNQIQFFPKDTNQSSDLKCYQVQIEWFDLRELNAKSGYVKENYDLMNQFIAGGDLKKIKELYELLN